MLKEMWVVKVGGSLGGAAAILDELATFPEPMVLVHGGGPQIGAFLERLGYETRFVRGERATPKEQIEVVEKVLTRLGKVLAFELSRRGRPAIALTGRDARLLLARPRAELGRVGRIEEVNPRPLKDLLAAGYTPVVAPIGVDAAGALNVNADRVAAAIAGALGAPILFLTDVEAVRGANGERLAELDPKAARALIKAGVVHGGMVPKVESALEALARGAPQAIIAKGQRGALHSALKGEAGTRFALV